MHYSMMYMHILIDCFGHVKIEVNFTIILRGARRQICAIEAQCSIAIAIAIQLPVPVPQLTSD